MAYSNAKDILPGELFEKIQEYAAGEIIYIPLPTEQKVGWGEKSGSRSQYKKRNMEINTSYKRGQSIKSLSWEYHLSESSIRKIITMKNKAC